ncbi:NAD(P)/FAD-dependent oxidoreductase [Saxibacter everestensis]|uniref:NAD(P)/FAD-dependent oxidoreductase n=1 Tax=Saxibacter everestensis TaxID=2909229 RepID=A0ABY8QT18_9MICO|nr:NAD(P)/FAD-dependent oxidoreductase [Brevibacteriaceae bacterium ZFBP1038]
MYDVVIVGGGAAGLSAAMTLGRSRRSVAVIDAGEPRNAPAAGVHGFLSRDGMNPLELLRAGHAEVAAYGGQMMNGKATSITRSDADFEVAVDDGTVVRGRRLLVTTGLIDELPAVSGLRERWGKDVLHCPYCHGWEVRDQAIGILGSGPMAVHQAQMFRQWSDNITLFLNTAPQPNDDEWEQLAARGISVVDGKVASLNVADDVLTGVVLDDGSTHPVQALAVAPRFMARADLLAGLGLQVADHPMGGCFVESDPNGLTTVPGVWVAGNVADLRAQVMGAAASGVQAAVAINSDLIAEDIDAAVATRLDNYSAKSEARNTERVLGDRRHGVESMVK